MRSTITSKFLFFFLVFFTARQVAIAQKKAAPAPDTTRLIEIVKGNSLREKLVDDSTSLQTIAGSVTMKEGLTLFNGDSAVVNRRSNEMEAFGNIHINQQDSIHTYSQYLKYVGQERIAYLKKDVRLTDKKGILYTQELEYDLKTNIATYRKGGKVVNGKTILTSEEGVYYSDTKDVYFKKDVHLVDPRYDIRTDSMLYNTQTQVVTFITQTHIKGKEGADIYTSNGTYDLKNGKAFFGDRTVFKDSTRTYVADFSAYDEKTHIAQLEGNAVIRDSVNGYSITGNQIYLNESTNSFLATRKPVLIFKGEGDDSTFVAADTLFSGIEKRDNSGNKKLIKTDTLKKTIVVDESVENIPADSTEAQIAATDSVTVPLVKEKAATDTMLKKIDPGFIAADSLVQLDTTLAMEPAKTLPAVIDSTNKRPVSDSTVKTADTTEIRYFQAFHHVRIFNDSLQAVCDSLFYSSADSVFRLYKDPLVFSNKSQIAGDTINLYTKNKKADRVHVFNNGILINEINAEMYNQIGGRTMNGYFKEGALDYMRVKGSPAESIFYPQDDDSAFTGMNRCKGDVIDIYFLDKAVNKVKVINDVDGILYPMKQIPADQRYLVKFKWEDARRPKNKLELFE